MRKIKVVLLSFIVSGLLFQYIPSNVFANEAKDEKKSQQAVSSGVVKILCTTGLVEQGKYQEAIDACTGAIQQNPKNATAYGIRGYAYHELGNSEQAIKDYSIVISLEPNMVVAYNNRGVAYRELGNYEQAINDFNKAVEIDPKHGRAYYHRAVAYDKLGNNKQAFKDYKVAFGLGDKDAERYFMSTKEAVPEPVSKVGWEFNGGRLYLDVGLQSAYFKGDTTYHIDFPGGASELEFPLKTFLLGPEVGLSYKNPQNQEKIRLNVKWLTNIDDGSGKMKDSDWLDGDGHSGLDIYSESKIKLKANIIDANLIYNFWPIKQLSIGPMLGYKYQKFEYDVSDVDQVGYGPYAPGSTGSVSGKVLDYKVTYHIPYFGLSSDVLLGKKFQANIKLGYTPWATAKDRDDHILRYKLSEGDTDGYACFANLNANWNFLPHWFLGVGGEYMKIHTTGTQHQYFYAGPSVGKTYDVDDKTTSEQWLFSAMVTYRF